MKKKRYNKEESARILAVGASVGERSLCARAGSAAVGPVSLMGLVAIVEGQIGIQILQKFRHRLVGLLAAFDAAKLLLDGAMEVLAETVRMRGSDLLAVETEGHLPATAKRSRYRIRTQTSMRRCGEGGSAGWGQGRVRRMGRGGMSVRKAIPGPSESMGDRGSGSGDGR